MKEKLKKDEVSFTQIKNTVLTDKNLSLKAKGLYGLIYSKPENWDFSVERLASESRDNFDATNNAVKELEKLGYLERVKRADGKKDWHIHLEPKNPTREKPYLGKSLLGKIPTISNKEIEIINNNNNKDNNKEKEKKYIKKRKNNFKTEVPVVNSEIINQDSPIEKQISEIIFRFRNLNPVYKSWFNRNPVREKCRSLLERFGFVKVSNAIAYIESIVTDKYAPIITTPAELETKWGKLQAYYLKQKNNNNNKYQVKI